jgi:hypothetical protein
MSNLYRRQPTLEDAYQLVLESKHINKKFARRYSKITGALLKAVPGSKEYQSLKSERDDLVSILKDHGKTPADLDEFLTKKEASEVAPEEQAEAKHCEHCGESPHPSNECSGVATDY